MNETHAEREIDEERAMDGPIPEMWAMSLADMDSALRRAMRGHISSEHRERIQGMLDDLDDIANTAPSYLID